ncbi:unnamed protein product [Phyllotreta striolata]|uniref:Uncharacterized protein n=1 Tax=Phyllotreta striolata TaxID=444603 RepID=A0A9N9XP55_PHYSR|nr:unnamed protein product [Phyllotreta striolata]
MERSSPRNRCHFQRKSPEPVQTRSKSSVNSHSSAYTGFRRTANDNLMRLNSNISEMLSESFRGIDSICTKVRECITDFNAADALQATVYNESFADEPSTEQALRKQQEDRLKYEELKERYRRYRAQRRPDGDPFDFARKSDAGNERGFSFGDAPAVETVPQETRRVEEVPVKCDPEASNDVKENYREDSVEEILALDDLPELPDVLVGEKPDEEAAAEKPRKSKGKSAKKRVRRRSLEEYAQAVKKEAQFEDFNSLKAVIQDLTERIDLLSNETLPVKCEEKPENRFETTLTEQRLNDAREEAADEEEDDEDEEEEEKKSANDPVVSLMKNISRLLGASLANALDSKTSLPNEFARLEAPDPDQEDLLLEDETQKKFLYLEQLLAKRKMDNIKTKNLLNDASDREVPESSYRSSNLRSRYSNSLYFNEKTMFKTSSKDNLNAHRKSKKINSVLTVLNYSNGSIEKLNVSETKTKPSKYKKLTENRKPKNRNLEYYKHKLDKFGGANWKQNLYKSGAIDNAGKSCSDEFGFEREASLVSFPNTESSKSETSVDFNRKSTKSGPKRAYGDAKTAHSDYEDDIRSDESEISADRVPVFGVANSENKSKGKGNWIKSKDVQMPFTHWNHLDILDDLTHKDLLPLCSEYPRKDVSLEEKSQEPNKDIQNTYLWKMVYEQEENDNVWNKLIQPTVEGGKNKSNTGEHPQDSPDNKTFKKQKSKRRTIEKLAPYMFDPKEESSRANQSLIVMPITVQYSNPPQIVKHNVNEEPDVLPSVVGTSRRIKTSRLEQQQAAREALSDREWSKQRKTKKKNNGNTSSPRTNDILREGANLLASSNDECAEYREKLTPQQTAYKKAIMRNLVKLKELKLKEKREERKMAGKMSAHQPKINPACVPHYTQPTIQSQNYFQRPIVQNPEKERHSARRKSFGDSKSDYERKMLSFKYSKSVGEKLVSFVNNQSPRRDLDTRHNTVPTNDSPRSPPDLDPKDMVMQLQNLKKEDGCVLSSIQKAVDVIENKMIDLLDAPSDLNFDAFDVMESEIKQVLDIMKVDARNPERLDGELKLEENLQKMSMQLFSKLESLLDSGSEYKEVTSGSEVVEEAIQLERPSSMTTLVSETKHRDSRQPKRISRVRSDAKTAPIAAPCDVETAKMGEEIATNEHIFDRREDVDADAGDFERFERHSNAFDTPKEEELGEEEAFWDTAEQLQRLNDILQDTDEPEFAPLQRQCATTNLDTVRRPDPLVPDDLTDSIMNLRDGRSKKTEEDDDDEEDKEDLGSDVESIDSDDFLTPSHTEFNYVCRDDEFLTPPEEAAAHSIDVPSIETPAEDENDVDEDEEEDLSTVNEASRGSDGSSSNFSDQVNDMIKTVEDIYTRLDRIQKHKNQCDETPEGGRMQLVKPYQTAVVALEPAPASYENVLNFLESLSDGAATGEVHSARFVTRLRYLTKPSCLRTNANGEPKKKVSFLVTQRPRAALQPPSIRRSWGGRSPAIGALKASPSLHNILRFLDALIEIGAEEETTPTRRSAANDLKIVELDGNDGTVDEIGLSEDLGGSPAVLSETFEGLGTSDGSFGCLGTPVVCERISPVGGLVTTAGFLARCKSKVVVLKSLYAFVYLLVFTALNMGYKCY